MLKGYSDFDLIRDETLNILLAGRDTVRVTGGLLRSGRTQIDPDRLQR